MSHFEPSSQKLKMNEKPGMEHKENTLEPESNLIYDDVDDEPELHMRTYVALMSMFMLNLVQVFALQGPPAVVWGIAQCTLFRHLLTRNSSLTSERTWIMPPQRHGFPTRSRSCKLC